MDFYNLTKLLSLSLCFYAAPLFMVKFPSPDHEQMINDGHITLASMEPEISCDLKSSEYSKHSNYHAMIIFQLSWI